MARLGTRGWRRVEGLERRVLLALAPLGPELPVNTYTQSDQIAAVVAMDAVGNFVVAWMSDAQDGSGAGIFARRFDASGVPRGDEFQVNTFTDNDQRFPSVAMDPAGDFVITWDSLGQDGNPIQTFDVYAQRYDAQGVAQGGEIEVNGFVASDQFFPAVAMDAAGDFVIAWSSGYQDGDGIGIYAQRFTPDGEKAGDEFLVNTTTESHQFRPTVAMDPDGDFVVAWDQVNVTAGDQYDTDVRAQRFNAAGEPQGTEFQADARTIGDDFLPSAAMDADGDFVIAWTGDGLDGSDYGIYARRYSADGVEQGSEFRVNTFTAGPQHVSSVAMSAAGDFVIAWQSTGQDGPAEGVYFQQYDAAGATVGTETRVNEFTAGGQGIPTVAMSPSGQAVVTWQSEGQDGNGFGIEARVYGVPRTTPQVMRVYLSGSAWTTQFRQALHDAGLGSAEFGYGVPSGAGQLDVIPWVGVDQVSITFSADVQVDAQDLAVGGVNLPSYPLDPAGFTYDAGTMTATWRLAAGTSFGNDRIVFDLDADAPGGVKTAAGIYLDGEWASGAAGDSFPSGDGTAGGDFLFRVNFLPGDINRDGRVDATDVVSVRARQGGPRPPRSGGAAYAVAYDVNGDLAINVVDTMQTRRRIGDVLPALPTGAVLFSARSGERHERAGHRPSLVESVLA